MRVVFFGFIFENSFRFLNPPELVIHLTFLPTLSMAELFKFDFNNPPSFKPPPMVSPKSKLAEIAFFSKTRKTISATTNMNVVDNSIANTEKVKR